MLQACLSPLSCLQTEAVAQPGLRCPSSARRPARPPLPLQSAIAMLSIQVPADPNMALTTLRQLAAHDPAVLVPRL